MNGAWKLLYCSKLTRLLCPPEKLMGLAGQGWSTGSAFHVSIRWRFRVGGGGGGGGGGVSLIDISLIE